MIHPLLVLFPFRPERAAEFPLVMKPLGEHPLVYPLGLGVDASERTGERTGEDIVLLFCDLF